MRSGTESEVRFEWVDARLSNLGGLEGVVGVEGIRSEVGEAQGSDMVIIG